MFAVTRPGVKADAKENRGRVDRGFLEKEASSQRDGAHGGCTLFINQML